MRLLLMDAALSHCLAALAVGGALRALRRIETRHGQPAALPPLVAAMLAEADAAGGPEAVAVGLGPGSFTGLRSAIALAQGIAAARGLPLVGITTGEALAGLAPHPVWAVTDNRRGGVFLERFGPMAQADEPPASLLDLAVPHPKALTFLVGDAAPRMAARLRAAGASVGLGDARAILPGAMAAVAELRLAGALPPRPVAPAYVDPASTT